MARTARSPLDMQKRASWHLIRETLQDVNEETEDMDAVNRKIHELLKKNKLKISRYRYSRHHNVKRLLSFYHRNPDKMPTMQELEPYETIKKCPKRIPWILSNRVSPKPRKVEVIDLTNED
jgi:hypothetical protein